jgi:hypothetical protein
MFRSPAVFAITVMFMLLNVGEGMLFVLLPVYASRVLHGTASLYGLLVSVIALTSLVGATVIGAVSWRPTLGRSIAAAQALGGLVYLGLAISKACLQRCSCSPWRDWSCRRSRSGRRPSGCG